MTKFQTLFQQLIAPLNVNYHKIPSAIIFQSIIIIQNDRTRPSSFSNALAFFHAHHAWRDEGEANQ